MFGILVNDDEFDERRMIPDKISFVKITRGLLQSSILLNLVHRLIETWVVAIYAQDARAS